MSRRRTGKKNSYTWPIILGLVVVVFIVGYLIYTQSPIGPGQSSTLIGKPVSSTVMDAVTGVSPSTLSAVGQGAAGILSPRNITGSALTLNGKPEVLYVGGDYCPYCAAERWAMVVAFSKFGTFSGVEFMQSSPTDIYSSTSTFSFFHANYTSNYISFVPVEYWDRNNVAQTSLTPSQQSLFSQYSTNQNIPFIDFGNAYLIAGSQYNPAVLREGGNVNGAPYNWTQISSQLGNSSSVFAQNIDGAANRLITAICKLDGGQPANVCSQTFAQVVSYSVSPPSTLNSQLMVAGILPAASPRFSPPRLGSMT